MSDMRGSASGGRSKTSSHTQSEARQRRAAAVAADNTSLSSTASSDDPVDGQRMQELDGRVCAMLLGDEQEFGKVGIGSVATQSPQSARNQGSTSLKITSSFSGSHRSYQSSTTVKSLDSTLADGHSHVHPSSLGRYVRFNVGGSLFFTTVETVCKRDTMLRAMFTGDMAVQVDKDGYVLIDRSGKHFASLLNFLRDGSTALPDSLQDSAELLAEAKYYLFEALVAQLDVHIEEIKKDSFTVCQMPMVTSQEEFQRLMSGTRKPVIRLVFNRSNNKYTYTGSSDDNLLKNLELFDRLATRFMDRVLFVKDIVGGSDICTWYFYGHGKRQAEISCDAIVYATDNKHIKIDFPEAKIYEECLTIMLFEERVLDAEKAAAAQARAVNLSRRKTRPMSDDE